MLATNPNMLCQLHMYPIPEAFAQAFGLAIGIGGETYVDAWKFIGPGVHAIKARPFNPIC